MKLCHIYGLPLQLIKCKSRVDQSLGIGKTVECRLLIDFLIGRGSKLENVHKYCTGIDNTKIVSPMQNRTKR